MVKPKKPEIGVWKTVESKGRRKHQKEKLKPIGEFSAKPQKQRGAKDANCSNKSNPIESIKIHLSFIVFTFSSLPYFFNLDMLFFSRLHGV